MQRLLIFVWLLACAFVGLEAKASTHDEALQRGRERYDFGRWVEARESFLEARKGLAAADRTGFEMVDYYLAACAVELGDPDAEQILRGYMKRYPGSVYNNEVRFALGSYYCAKGEMQQARTCFSQCNYKALSRSEKERYDLRMGYVAFAEGSYEEADGYFARVDARSEYADHATYYRAYIDYAAGRRDEAKAAFQQLLTSDAYGAVAPYYLLQIEFQEGNYRYVVEQSDLLLAQAGGARRAELERVVAESWFHLEGYQQTLEHMDRYAKAGGEANRDSNYLRGFSLYRLARYDEAIAPLRAACGAEDALTQNASYHLADCYLRQGRKEEAMQAFAMATNEQFDAAIAEDALFNYAKLQYELGGGAFNGAIHQLSRYLERYPHSERADEARTLLVAAYYNSRDYDAAYRALKAMPSMDADLKAALQKITYFRALEAYQRGDLTTAKQGLQETMRLQVSARYTALARFWLGEIAYREGNYAEAVAAYNGYLQRAPRGEREYALACYNLGYCHFNEERLPQAEQSFNRFLELYTHADGYRADAQNRLGDLAYADRRFEEALTWYNRVRARQTTESHYAAYRRAMTLGVLRRTSEQEAALREIMAKGQGDYLEKASYELGSSYMARENYAAGATQLERFVADYPASPLQPQAWSALGLAYLNLGKRQESIAAYQHVVSAAPQSAEAREALRSIREIYLADGAVEDYFAYAEQVGVEHDLSAMSRDSLSFAAAQQLYLADRLPAAEKSLRSYLKSYPKGAWRTDALYYLSDCYLKGQNNDAAIETLTELADQGTHPYLLQTLRSLVDLTWNASRYEEAAAAYRKLYAASTVASERKEAMTGYVRATLAQQDPTRVEPMAKEVLAAADAGKVAHREARFAWAEQLRQAGNQEQAKLQYTPLATDVSTREGSASAYYLLEMQYDAGRGDLDAVERAIFAYAEQSPKSYWLAKAYLLLGDLYLKKGDHFQARATYQSVADGYSPADDGIVAEAKERIQKLTE
ncbi:MAG: tetratricopeptide repeat protein [Rikenellaceae bacterium]|nr:tetratricopeptide repeat protein [Rikenellaceae bacterium]